MHFTHLKEEYVKEVATILSNKYQTARENLSILSDKYESMERHIERISRYINHEHFLVCIEDGKIAGFINGIFIDQYKGTAKGALVLPSMHGVADGFDKLKIYNLLYREISKTWTDLGYYTHSILLYINEKEVIDTFVYNGFGMYVIDAVRSLSQIKIPDIFDDIKIRKATQNDLPKMLGLIEGINEHLKSAPIFLYHDGLENYIEEYSKWLETNDNILWIAENDKQIVGYLKTNISEINQDEQNDGQTMGINGAYVKPEMRGKYIMSRLINSALVWANEKNLIRCSTDFETANYEGSNFWLRHFTPYSYALIRRIDERNHLNK